MVSIEDKYREKYDHINQDMCERIISQRRQTSTEVGIFYFNSWNKTKEGERFWALIYQYERAHNLTEETVKLVYEQYKIPFIPNKHQLEIWFQ